MKHKASWKSIFKTKLKPKEIIGFIEEEEHNYVISKRIHDHRLCNTFFDEVKNFYLKNKKIRKTKIRKILENNLNPKKEFTLNILEKPEKWYKGDYFYFKGNYDAIGMRRMTTYKIIIK